MKTITIRITLVLSVFFILIAGLVKANIIDVDKKGLINGRISDSESNAPVEFVNVDLYDLKDSTLVAGTLTDTEGRFTISMLGSGKYYVEISENNFEKKLIQQVIIDDNISRLNLGEITLNRIQRKSPKLFSRTVKSVNTGEQQIVLATKK
ncbi:MAG TPA: carboxypeptidase-like regulatory domain-containing protein [Draconibacterium sp.]|nr:carboxypeptidase-like regulatory domain-containing protein [Draconibacterium sp.]